MLLPYCLLLLLTFNLVMLFLTSVQLLEEKLLPSFKRCSLVNAFECICVYIGIRAGLRMCGAQLGTISVSPGSQSTCTKVCRIGHGAQLGAIGLRPALIGIYMQYAYYYYYYICILLLLLLLLLLIVIIRIK